MKLKVVSIGNSRGIRIPKPLLEQAGIQREVEIEAEGNTLILRPVSQAPRKGWAEAFQAMTEQGDDQLMAAEPSEWDQEEWEWK